MIDQTHPLSELAIDPSMGKNPGPGAAVAYQEYADIAIALAYDQAQRESLRTTLRDRLLASPLLDHEGFTRKLERHFSTVTRSSQHPRRH